MIREQTTERFGFESFRSFAQNYQACHLGVPSSLT